MSVHSIQRKRRRDPAKIRCKSIGVNCHEEFVTRICRSLYYAHLPTTERFSLPITEVAAELFSEVKCGRSLDRLSLEEASSISRNACVSPASLVLALLYLERLKISAPQYLDTIGSTQLFLVSSLVASKFLNDDGEEDEVLNSEWAVSADISVAQLNKLEKDFLAAIKWEVFVESDEFWRRLELLEERIAVSQATRRGFFTYSDLVGLLGYIDSLALAQTLLSVGAVCLTAYAAGVVSMVGSTALVSTLQRTASSLVSVQRLSLSNPVHSNRTFSPHSVHTGSEDLVPGCLHVSGDMDSSDRLAEASDLSVDSLVYSSVLQLQSPSSSSPLPGSGGIDEVETSCDEGCSSSVNLSSCFQVGSTTDEYWWLREESLTYIIGSVVKPWYSYAQLVATH